jgi:ribose transport system permease protein
MSNLTALRPERAPLAAHDRSLGTRILAATATPGGAVFVLVAVLLIANISANPNFGEAPFLIRFVGRIAPLVIVALGQYFVIVAGEFDLSMAAVISLQVVLASNLIGDDAGRILPVMVLMLVLGAAVGVVNGLATTILRVPSFIVTLGMMLALNGIVDQLTGGSTRQNPADQFRDIGRGGFENVPVVEILPYSVLILAALCVAGAWLMRRPFGRALIAAGDNPATASYAGASLIRLKTQAFVLSSLSATVAGILLVGYAGASYKIGIGYEFQAITAVVLGGVLLGGGRGWVLSAAAGAFALELLVTLLNSLEVIETEFRTTVQGVIVIVAVAVAGRAWQAGRKPSRRRRTPTDPTDLGDNRTTQQPGQQPGPGTTTGEVDA